jgi:5-methylcytosine-specific restriction endonuclease McrA
MKEAEVPRGVGFLKEALAQRMGRPAAIRPVKNRLNQWFIFDPSFAVIQRGTGSNSRGYRSGIFVDDNEINFFNVHSRTPAILLRRNLLEQPEALLNAAEQTVHLRRHHYMHFSSRSACRKNGAKRWVDTINVIESASWKDFKQQLTKDTLALIRDMFPELPSSGRIGTGDAVRGSDFRLLLAEYHRVQHAKSDEVAEDRASQIIEAAWHLFACLYPWESPKTRDASLRRAMLSKPGLLACEYKKIEGSCDSECDGSDVQAAHIVPYSQGGSDRYWNGMWLCVKHHRMTEGRVRGRRSRTSPDELQVRLNTPFNDL